MSVTKSLQSTTRPMHSGNRACAGKHAVMGLGLALSLSLIACTHAEDGLATNNTAAMASAAPAGNIFYELEVVFPGTRSQGVRGKLYDRNGDEAEPGSSGNIETNFGRFDYVPCVYNWDVCGFLPEAMQSQATPINEPNVFGPTLFRLHVTAACSRSQRFWGELIDVDGEVIAPSDSAVTTPLSVFVYRTGAGPYGAKGWFPEFWREMEGRHNYWPCT